MRLTYLKTLITGKPGAGKTTLIQKALEGAGANHAKGFITVEMRSKGARVGFELRGLNGERRILSHVEIDSPQRVGRYGVDVRGFEDFLEGSNLLHPTADLIVVDEIGKMELLSNRFRRLVLKVLEGNKPVLASIPLKGDRFVSAIKQRPDIHLLEVTPANRHRLLETILVNV